ncbi:MULTISPECIES: DUF1656 domain-containing protein [unclassified Acinetobacter]|uniref:DUF1656 domain-containing protein n=1 Tax=unclassified Acinetobacter TaxID=196816 RepID=UPI0015D3DD16|nr:MULTISPECIES: DUF1656 domain-containing protein [unclassified Acinetobacter]UNW05890.1 DUF1656 domain-containing protein [Acinetobacter variabilis]
MGELNIYGVYVPILLIQAVIAYVLLRILMKWLDKLVANDWIIMPNIFYLCIYVLLLGAVHWAGLLL